MKKVHIRRTFLDAMNWILKAVFACVGGLLKHALTVFSSIETVLTRGLRSK